MKLEKNLKNVKEHNEASLEADFVCECGNDYLEIFHSGSLKKGLFGGITLNKKSNQIIIKAKCPVCFKTYILYDSTKDGNKPKGTALSDFEPLVLKNGEKLFQINLKYNYYEENFKTDRFETVFIDIKNENSKEIRIYEE